MADGPSGRAGFPFLRRSGEPRLPLLRRTLRPRLSGAVAARHAPSAAAPALRRAAGSLIARHEKRAAPARRGPFSLAPRRERTTASADGPPHAAVAACGVGIGA